MGYVYVKIFLGTPVHLGASDTRHHAPISSQTYGVGAHLLAAGIKPMASGKAERVRPFVRKYAAMRGCVKRWKLAGVNGSYAACAA